MFVHCHTVKSQVRMRVGGKFSHLAEAQRRIAESQDQLLSMSRLGTCNQDIQHRFQGIPGPQAPHQQTGPSIKETIGGWRFALYVIVPFGRR